MICTFGNIVSIFGVGFVTGVIVTIAIAFFSTRKDLKK
jgi:hypothetical protein